jgi:hypothetical protein
MGIAYYKSCQFPTPAELRRQYIGQRALVIGTGTSTEKLLKYKSKIKERFDVVIGLNFATRDFEDIMDFHMIMEMKPIRMAAEMSLDYRRDLPRVLNYKAIKYFPKDMNIIKARRESFLGRPKITKYISKNMEGLLEYRKFSTKYKFCFGTVMLQALHFACILGCKNIYLVGADLMFKGNFDHYYKDKFYRKPSKSLISRSPLITTELNGKMISTTSVFKKSAKYIDGIIIAQCNPQGIKIYDFSEGLIEQAIKTDIDLFFTNNA